MGKVVKEVCKIMNTSQVHTTAYHPQTDGLVERFNATLATMLSMYVSSHQRDWDEFIPYVLFAYRTSIQETTQETPFYLMYGRDARLPIDVALTQPTVRYTSTDDYRVDLVDKLQHAFTQAKENTERAQQKQKLYADEHSKEPTYEIGEKVWVYAPVTAKGLSTKLLHPWSGPYEIIAKTSPVNFKIQTCDEKRATKIVHSNRMKPFVDPEKDLEPGDDETPPEVDDTADGNTFNETIANGTMNSSEPEKNVDVRVTNRTVCEVLDKLWTRNEHNRLEPKYFVRWRDMPVSDNSWVSPKDVEQSLLEEFERTYRQKRVSDTHTKK